MADAYEVDLLVVGAGPTGLFAAYYAGFRDLTVAIVDALPEPGGQVTAMYPEKMIFDVAGFPEIRGRDLVAQLVRQAAQYAPVYLLGRAAQGVSDMEDGLHIELADGDTLDVKALLITAGIGEFSPRPLPAAEGWLGNGVVHFVPELSAHSGHDVLVIGGGDSAFDWALALHPIANSVTVVHRRARFRAHPGLMRKASDLGVPVLTNTEVAEIRGDATGVHEVELRDQDGERSVLPAQTVVAALGFTASLGPIESWGLEVDKRSVQVDTRMRTTRSRMYAAGDVANYPGKVNLIATGFGEAATAVNNIAVEINPRAHLFPGHSSDLDE